jgi:hypothetical protein
MAYDCLLVHAPRPPLDTSIETAAQLTRSRGRTTASWKRHSVAAAQIATRRPARTGWDGNRALSVESLDPVLGHGAGWAGCRLVFGVVAGRGELGTGGVLVGLEVPKPVLARLEALHVAMVCRVHDKDQDTVGTPDPRIVGSPDEVYDEDRLADQPQAGS